MEISMQYLKPLCRSVIAVGLALVLVTSTSDAALRRLVRAGQGPGPVQLPYTTADGHGNMWMVYQPSMIQMQGNFPIYGQAASIMINGNQPNQVGQARIDDKTGELVMENMQAGGFSLTRRIQFNADDGYIRVIDQVKNNQGAEQQLNMVISSNINYGIQMSQMIPDPRKAGQNIGWVGQVQAGQMRAAVEVYAGSGAKFVPTMDSPQGNNFIQATINTPVPAGKEVAFAHFHMVLNTSDQGLQWVKEMKEAKLFADLPKEVAREIMNFRIRGGLLGDLDVLRGDAMDVVELRTGDKLNGNLTETSYKLDTFYGTVELPVDKVVCIINAGQFRPRQLIVTADGQIFGGHLEKPTVQIELVSGQKTDIPLAQISRVGYRHRADDKEESADEQTLEPPYVLMATGDRVGVNMPAGPINVVTRYGQLALSPDLIASIVFNSEDTGVHTVYLTDGSRFNGLVTATDFEVKLNTGGKDQTVKFPVGAMNRFVLKNRSEDKDDSAPALNLKKDDLLVGTLQGALKLDTAFDTIALNAPEIKAIVHPKDNASDLSVTTWDGTVFSGQLQEPTLACKLASGIDVQIPVGLLESYTNPVAAAPAMMIEKIKGMVGDLNADEWKQRDAAEKQLVKMGPGVIPTLKQMRDGQPPEAQQRIDAIVKQLQK
jgi:hypothetical protein